MTVSLIISTYNWPRALYLCLDSVMQQTVMPSEILIADDGSGMSTRDVVKHFENISPVPVRHIWHEDNGFRLAAIRNKAIAAAHGAYIIQIDGDLILHRSFIQDHMIFAREGCYVTGSRGIITEMLTQKVLSGEITSLSPLMKGIRSSNNVVRVPIMSILYHTFGPTRGPRGCNMAFWRNDLISVNGYDEGFKGWGFEDAELCIRLDNSGLNQRCMKFRGIVFHLHHQQAARSGCSSNATRTASASTAPAAKRDSTGISPRASPMPGTARLWLSAADPPAGGSPAGIHCAHATFRTTIYPGIAPGGIGVPGVDRHRSSERRR